MTGSITLSSNNLSPNGVLNLQTTPPPYSRFSMNLRGMNLQGSRIGLKKMYVYYSWPNIRNATTVQIQWPVGGSYTTFNWILPANTNYKDMATLNQSLQDFCIANGLYLINGADNVYYLELASNEVEYTIELNLFKVPTSLPASHTAPSGFAGYPTTSKTPKFILPTGSDLCDIMGFAAGTYDGATTAVQLESTYVPQFNPVGTIFITCNIAKNEIPINGSTVIGSFTTRGTEYGAMVVVEPNTIDFYEIDTNSNMLECTLWDQDWNQLYVMDPKTTLELKVIKK